MTTVEIRVPDIGDFAEVAVIELLVQPGDAVKVDQSLITVESDKASMEIPSSGEGVVERFLVKLGDKVSEGTPIAVLRAGQAAPDSPPAPVPAPGGQTPATAAVPALATPAPVPAPVAPVAPVAAAASAASAASVQPFPGQPPASSAPERLAPASPPMAHRPEAAVVLDKPHASPSVRKFARELGVELREVQGSGPKGRITQADVQVFVKARLQQADRAVGLAAQHDPAASAAAAGAVQGAGLALLAWPRVDFAKFGEVERKPLARIRKISGANLHRNWVMIPHVTQHDEADITDLEALRVQLNLEQGRNGAKITMLAFLIKALVHTLRRFPEFNASLDGEELVVKKYAHIGFAADTPQGLVVPVLRDADRKGVYQIADETSELASRAREGKLSPAEMQGGSMSISSLGGIGGSFFTPIINAPEVAILGVGRSQKKPVWDEGAAHFVPRLLIPLSLSYDHRVIDGAAAARFITHLGRLLSDFRRVAL